MTLTPDSVTAIQRDALAHYPRESCGLVIVDQQGNQTYIPCINNAESPSAHFRLSGKDFAAAEDLGEIIGIVHSHPDVSALPSEGDLVSCEAHGVPWYIVSVIKDAGDQKPTVRGIHYMKPKGYEAPLEGREFSFGILDCWILIRDYYKRVLGIELAKFEYYDGFDDRGENPYMDHFEEYGFESVNAPPQLHDIIVFQFRATQPNHAGVCLGDGQFLHHMYNRLSKKDIYGGQWAEMTRAILRYKDLPNVS